MRLIMRVGKCRNLRYYKDYVAFVTQWPKGMNVSY
jgi:hypothetical protein